MEITQQKTSWWKRNWKWALPSGGCLTVIIIVFSFIVYNIYTFGNELSTKTNVFAFAKVVMEVQSNQEVIKALGTPIEIEDGDYDPELNNGIMILDLELKGSKSNGTVDAKATKTENGWEFEIFTVTLDETGEIIDLADKINN